MRINGFGIGYLMSIEGLECIESKERQREAKRGRTKRIHKIIYIEETSYLCLIIQDFTAVNFTAVNFEK